MNITSQIYAHERFSTAHSHTLTNIIASFSIRPFKRRAVIEARTFALKLSDFSVHAVSSVHALAHALLTVYAGKSGGVANRAISAPCYTFPTSLNLI